MAVSLPAVTSQPADADQPSARSDRLGYAVGLVLLIGGGILFTTPVLNWICGPALIVVSVVVVGRIQDALATRRERGSS